MPKYGLSPQVRVGLLATAIAGLSGPALAAGNSDQKSANSSATVIAPISINKVRDLQFGAIVQPTGQGTLTINADGSIGPSSLPSGLYSISQTATPRQTARFAVQGESGYEFNVNAIPASGFIEVTKGADKMRVDNFVHSADSPQAISASGSSFDVGARLTVKAGQAIGSYTGTFTVTVTYN